MCGGVGGGSCGRGLTCDSPVGGEQSPAWSQSTRSSYKSLRERIASNTPVYNAPSEFTPAGFD